MGVPELMEYLKNSYDRYLVRCRVDGDNDPMDYLEYHETRRALHDIYESDNATDPDALARASEIEHRLHI